MDTASHPTSEEINVVGEPLTPTTRSSAKQAHRCASMQELYRRLWGIYTRASNYTPTSLFGNSNRYSSQLATRRTGSFILNISISGTCCGNSSLECLFLQSLLTRTVFSINGTAFCVDMTTIRTDDEVRELQASRWFTSNWCRKIRPDITISVLENKMWRARGFALLGPQYQYSRHLESSMGCECN